MRGRLFIISAPSGAGKTSLVEAALPLLQETWPIEQVKTYTTKQPRSTNLKMDDFHFIDNDEFERRIQEGFFLEWSDAYGAYYGTPRSVIDQMAEGRSLILVIDRVGAKQVVTQIPDAILVWITVVTVQVLKERLDGRGTESPAQMAHRLERAQVEIDLEAQNCIYPYHIINDDFGTALEQLVALMKEKLA